MDQNNTARGTEATRQAPPPGVDRAPLGDEPIETPTEAARAAERGEQRGSGRARDEGPSDDSGTGARRTRLEKDAKKISEGDFKRIDREIPKKLADIGELKNGMEWMGEMIGRVTVLYDMVRDAGFRIDGKTKTLIAAGLLYFLLPLDMTPDFIPGLGFIDDALVLGALWKVVQNEVDRYLAYRSQLASES